MDLDNDTSGRLAPLWNIINTTGKKSLPRSRRGVMDARLEQAQAALKQGDKVDRLGGFYYFPDLGSLYADLLQEGRALECHFREFDKAWYRVRKF
jgi:hypothetical protein